MSLQSTQGEWFIGNCLKVLLLWALAASLPGLVLGILLSLVKDGGISLPTVGIVTVITAVLLHVLLVLYLFVSEGRDRNSAAPERLGQDPEIDLSEATLETIEREFPQLEFTDGDNAYHHIWDGHLYTGSAFLSELRALGVDAELTRCWSPSGYSLACEITVSGQPIAWIDIADWDGIWETDFLIPDPRIKATTQQIKLRTIRSKNFPVFGQVRGVVWKGDDLGTGLTEGLNGIPAFREPLLHQNELTLGLDDERLSWVLTMRGWNLPTMELWRCYLSIADLLLKTPIPVS